MDEKFFCLTVDAESDDCWLSAERIELDNFREIPRFQRLCEEYQIIPTYLLTYEYATYKPAIKFFRQKLDENKCEVGLHLHTWSTPPYENEKNRVDLPWLYAYQYELPDDLFKQKADLLFDTINENFGICPASHRAGRWGIDQRTVKWLISKGFIADTSIVPLNSYRKERGVSSGGPCFLSLPHTPYLWSVNLEADDVNASILEIPVTVEIPKKFIFRLLASWMQKGLPGKYIASYIFKKLGGGIILRPNPAYPIEVLLQVARAAIRADFPVVNLMLHSSELALGSSPFTRTMFDHQRVWSHLGEIFNYVSGSDLKPVSLSNAGTLILTEIQNHIKK
jgi:hypothetical protein